MTSTLRPDEKVYEADVERSKKRNNIIENGVKTAVGIGAAALGGGIASRVLPFLSEYVPTDLAMKGISKVSPRLGEFLKNGQSMGLDVKEGMNFIKEKMGKAQSQSKRNIIEKHSPELHQFISDKIKEGRSPLQAGGLALLGEKGIKPFKNVIDKIVKEHKSDWPSILESVYGAEQQAQQPKTQNQPPIQQTQQPQQQQGQGDQALLAALDKILKM